MRLDKNYVLENDSNNWILRFEEQRDKIDSEIVTGKRNFHLTS